MYRVLYRKWRPQVFSDVVGQPQVTLTLSAQVRENRLSHAYLFTGSRGTGKTTCAKILAKAVNCLHPVNGEPCNECEICKGIDGGTVLDIVEMDAASNRGIDDIRLMRDEVSYLPSQAKYRVYIIDEVHMLTPESFNALLKTLEEPPEHVKFILATTEVHKLPSTILSRCQRFDFRRIEPKYIAERLMMVAAAENAALEEDAAMLIARIADGGMRDALSLLDRAISVDARVTTEVVSASAGLMGREYIYDLIRAIAERDTAKSLVILDGLHNASCDTERLLTELSEQFRNFLIIKTVEHPENLIVCTAEELEELKGLSGMFTSAQVLHALNVLTAAADAVKHTQNRRIEAEMALIRLCSPENDNDTSALLARISVLEQELEKIKKNGVIAAPADAYKAPVRERPAVKTTLAPDVPFAGQTEEITSVPSADEDEDEYYDPEPLPENSLFGGSDPVFDDVPVPDDSDAPFGEELPFGPDSGEPVIFSGGSASFEGFGSEPETGSFNDRFAAADDDDDEPVIADVKINDDFMSKYGSSYNEAAADEDTHEAAAGGDKTGALDERTWVKILVNLESIYSPIRGQLTNSSAFIRGSTLFVHPVKPFVKMLTPEPLLAEKMVPIVKQILGKEYTIRYDE